MAGLKTPQMEFDFSTPVETPKTARRAISAPKRAMRRPHFKTTTLTVSRSDFDGLRNGSVRSVSFCNDIVSSCRGSEDDTTHHSIRRIELLGRQYRGGFVKVNVRCEQGREIACEMCGAPWGEPTDCSGRIEVRISVSKQENKNNIKENAVV